MSAVCCGREGVNCLTIDEITSCVRKNLAESVKKNMDLDIKSVTELLVNLSTVNGVSSDTEARLKSAAEIVKILYVDVVEQSSYVTIKTLFDLGLLTQGMSE